MSKKSGETQQNGASLASLTVDPGLCRRCRHAGVVRSRTAAYLRCSLSDEDPRFLRYPPLPVVHCVGFREASSEGPEIAEKLDSE